MGEPFCATYNCCRDVIFVAGYIFFLHANLTVYDVDPTAGKSDPRGTLSTFLSKNTKKPLIAEISGFFFLFYYLCSGL
jgi:hypothetical protein